MRRLNPLFFLFATAALLTASPTSASMIVSDTWTLGTSVLPFSATGEGTSLTHYATPGDPSSGVTGSTQEYLITFMTGTPDPQNYGLRISKGFDPSFGGVDVLDHGTVIGSADWALSYYQPTPASAGSPWHTVLSGTTSGEGVLWDPANDGPGEVVDIAYGFATLNYDGLYHKVTGTGTGTHATGSTAMQLNVTLYEVGMNGSGQIEWSTVPEPSTALLLGLGLTGLAAKGRRRNRS